MTITIPIIKSLLDNDLYTFTVGQVAFKLFPTARVKYKFINRSKTKFPDNFVEELKHQLQLMQNLRLQNSEYAYMNSLGHFSFAYLKFLSEYRYNPEQLTISNVDGNLEVEFEGLWIDMIMWEVPFLALVSELYYKLAGKYKEYDWFGKIAEKVANLSNNNCKWMEFGTRRRFDFDAQDEVVSLSVGVPGFLGTSNVYLAMKYKVPCMGTMSHQGPMAMQALYGARNANKQWRKHWIDCYKNKLLTFLPDTFTTDVFLRDFDRDEALLWNLRQDSGDPNVFVDKILNFYKSNNIDPLTKTVILSDSLNDKSFIEYTNKYRKQINIAGGIGTFFTNDCGHAPVSMVIKLTAADFGKGMIPVVKLSDTEGKHTGELSVIKRTKEELNII